MIANQELWQKLIKEHAELEEIVAKYEEYKNAKSQIEELKEMLREPEGEDFKAMVEEELAEHEESSPEIGGGAQDAHDTEGSGRQ